jgi:hypothetical protein
MMEIQGGSVQCRRQAKQNENCPLEFAIKKRA